MFRVVVSRSAVYRISQRGVLQSRCLRRYASSAAGGQQSGSSFAALSLGAIVTLGSVLFVSPFDLKSVLSAKSKKPEEPAQAPAQEPVQAQESAEEPKQEPAQTQKAPEEDQQQSQESKRDEQKPNKDVRETKEVEQESQGSEKDQQQPKEKDQGSQDFDNDEQKPKENEQEPQEPENDEQKPKQNEQKPRQNEQESQKGEQGAQANEQEPQQPAKASKSSQESVEDGRDKKSEPEQKSESTEKSQDGEDGETEQGATAYNPDTGEINWDCPCLGGMAHGPCGEEFKSAFSCFVYSEADPKGIDCVEKFQHMQDCFRQHPEHYAEQLKDEEEAAAAQESVDPVAKESAAALDTAQKAPISSAAEASGEDKSVAQQEQRETVKGQDSVSKE